MFFGLTNAPANFQDYINNIFAEKLEIYVKTYLNNMLIYTENLGQSYAKVICWVLDQLWKLGFFANLIKC